MDVRKVKENGDDETDLAKPTAGGKLSNWIMDNHMVVPFALVVLLTLPHALVTLAPLLLTCATTVIGAAGILLLLLLLIAGPQTLGETHRAFLTALHGNPTPEQQEKGAGTKTDAPVPPNVLPPARRIPHGLHDEQALRTMLERQTTLPYIGSFARDALRQMGSAAQKEKQAMVLLSDNAAISQPELLGQFGQAADGAASFVRGQAQLVSGVCLALEYSDYTQLADALKVGSYRCDTVDDHIQEQRLATYQSALDRLTRAVNDSERVLLELDRFSARVIAQMSNPTLEDSRQIVYEMQEMTTHLNEYWA